MEREIRLPERQLLAAVLKRALFDYFGGRREERESARQWFFGEENSEELFSFAWVCAQLDISPDEFVDRISTVRPRGSQKAQEWWYNLRFQFDRN
jgi:hypothetical protein